MNLNTQPLRPSSPYARLLSLVTLDVTQLVGERDKFVLAMLRSDLKRRSPTGVAGGGF